MSPGLFLFGMTAGIVVSVSSALLLAAVVELVAFTVGLLIAFSSVSDELYLKREVVLCGAVRDAAD